MAMNENQPVTDCVEKPANPKPVPGNPEKALVSMGIYVFSAKVLYDELARDHELAEESSHDFGKDIIPSMISRAKVMAFPFHDHLKDGPAFLRDVSGVVSFLFD